jgi:hypothetical protein
MQCETHRRSRRHQPARFASQIVAGCLGVLLLSAAPSVLQAQTVAGSSVYVRTDSDTTTVVAPRLHVGAPVGDATRIDLVYTADVWTSASIDIRTSASRRVNPPSVPGAPAVPVTEQRDEIDTSITHELDTMTLAGSYRYSHEPDYESHGGTLGSSFSFADKSATLDLRLAGAFDQVGRAGDPGFHRAVRNLGARVSFTQVLDRQMFAQVIYELMDAHGYNSSPYRFVGVGTPNGLCSGKAYYCIPEVSPDERLRHALGANLRRALGESFSIGVGYRFYLDDWHVMSHTLLGELAWNATRHLMFALRYRFYTQSAAAHYRPSYDISETSREYYTNDKELSAFGSHRIAFDIEHSFELDTSGHQLDVVLSVAPSLFQYTNYLPIKQITALEMTLATVFKL